MKMKSLPMMPFEYNFTSLCHSFGDRCVIRDIRIRLKASQCTLLVGENGAGKSTLLKIMAGLQKPDNVQLYIQRSPVKWGQGKSTLLKNVMYLHQQPYLFDGSVERNLYYLARINRLPDSNIAAAAQWAGIEGLLDKNAKTLSGGEKQRVALARAYLRQPHVILLDEPTANLDEDSRHRTLALLQKFRQAGCALVIASHEADLFLAIQDERLRLKRGRLSKEKPGKQSSVIALAGYQEKRGGSDYIRASIK